VKVARRYRGRSVTFLALEGDELVERDGYELPEPRVRVAPAGSVRVTRIIERDDDDGHITHDRGRRRIT
jgi:hypothetical protein